MAEIRTGALALVAGLVACSGRLATVEDDETVADAAVTPDASPGADASTGDARAADAAKESGVTDSGRSDAGLDCNNLRLQIDKLRGELLKCCPQCDSLQCHEALDDICCPISTSRGGTTEAKEFQRAVTAYKASCPIGCPAVPCAIAPSRFCDPNTSTCR
jgi:hypothetical protein